MAGKNGTKELANEELGVRFTVPERPTVRQQLAYKAAVAFSPRRPDVYERYFAGVATLADEWECEAIPTPETLDMDEEDDPRVADIVFWACNALAAHMDSLEALPKN